MAVAACPTIAEKEPMSSITPLFNTVRHFTLRVVKNEATRRGIAAAGAGFIMSMILEAFASGQDVA